MCLVFFQVLYINSWNCMITLKRRHWRVGRADEETKPDFSNLFKVMEVVELSF